jgi:EpsI family protein
MNSSRRYALIVLGLSGGSVLGAEVLKPRTKLADQRPQRVDLETMVPKRFGDWIMDERALGGIVNPVAEETLKRIYSQILTRSYLNQMGQRVMVSVAYGDDQRKYLALHYPEVCYPAQGFSVKSNVTGQTEVAGQTLPLRRLETFMGPNRYEPVTYWTTMGDYTSFGGLPRRMIELRYGLQRVIPDGLLFRVSTIGQDSQAQFDLQERFIRDLLSAVGPEVRALLTGQLQT